MDPFVIVASMAVGAYGVYQRSKIMRLLKDIKSKLDVNDQPK